MIYNDPRFSFQILTVDYFAHEQGTFHVKARPYAALSFRLSGTGAFDIGNKHLITKPGDVLFLPAGRPYKVEYSVSESIVVHLVDCHYAEAENISIGNRSEIGICFDYLFRSWKEHRSMNKAKSIVYDVLAKMENDQTDLMSHTVLANCIRYMNENFRNPDLNIKTVCEIGFISESSLQRAFLKHFQESPKQYLNRFRMNRALELLKDNTFSIKEIASLCGFADEKYFSRAFKKTYGYPPSEFRKHIFI